MMGDRDYRSTIKNAIDSIGRELEIKIDPNDFNTINLQEVVQCLRRSYYDRTDSKEIERRGFNDLLSGLLRKLEYGSEAKDFAIDDIKLKGQADMIVDDIIVLFRPSQTVPESPLAQDLLYLNSCLWIYDKTDGMIIYITNDREEFTFSLTRDKKMFEEVIRRVRVLSDLLKEQKTPILEPSVNCVDCQYYQRCFISKKSSKQLSLAEMLGLSRKLN
jgi:CRISPR-associated exonuclease Cas4